jgi:6-phosphogluconolactonase
MSANRKIFEDAGAAARAAGDHILSILQKASKSGIATLAVSGGSAPAAMFRHMASVRFDWSEVHIFWVDERPVPPDDDQSNYKLANENWLKPARIPEKNIHRIHAELPPEEAAQQYVGEIRRFFMIGSTELPRFDVIHLGMGTDAHTASLFPGEPLLSDRERIAAAVSAARLGQQRVTLLPGVLLAGRHNVMLVTGGEKAETLRRVFSDSYQPEQLPAQLMAHEAPQTQWFLDKAAAHLIAV